MSNLSIIKLGWPNWFYQFLCERWSSFNSKGFCYSYGWFCSVCERETYICMGLISRKFSGFLFMFSTGFMVFSVLFLFPLSITLSLCTVCDAISHNIVEVLSINPSADVHVFGDCNFLHGDWLTYSGRTDRPGELLYSFYLRRPYLDC